MLETHLHSPVTRRRLRTGPAADHIDVFADWLHINGYKPVSIDLLLRSLAGWTDWLLVRGFTAQDLLPGFGACKLAIKTDSAFATAAGPITIQWRPQRCSSGSFNIRVPFHFRLLRHPL